MDFQEFKLLGHTIRFKPDPNETIEPLEVIKYLREEASAVGLELDGPENELMVRTDKSMLLLALKLAAEKLKLEREYKASVSRLEESVKEAMDFVDRISLETSEESRSAEIDPSQMNLLSSDQSPLDQSTIRESELPMA